MILIDTNFLIDILKFKIHFDFKNSMILKQTINELNHLNTKESKLALNIIKTKNIKIVDNNQVKDSYLKDIINGANNLSKVDKDILLYAFKNKLILATNDKELKQQAKNIGLKVMYIKQRKLIEVE